MSSVTFALKPGAGGGGAGAGEIPITDAGIIANIIADAVWDDTGYTGSVVGLVTGNVYYDVANEIRYYFNGTILTREKYNDVA